MRKDNIVDTSRGLSPNSSLYTKADGGKPSTIGLTPGSLGKYNPTHTIDSKTGAIKGAGVEGMNYSNEREQVN